MQRRVSARLLAALALIIGAAGACSDDDPFAPLPRSGPPEQMEFVISGYFAPFTKYRAEGDSVLYYHREWDAQVASDSVWIVPTDAQWREFWAAARRAGVPAWKRRYVAENIVDGAGWGLMIEIDGETRVSSGSNAWPDRRGIEHEGEMTDDFRGFMVALDELIGRGY